MTRRSTYRALTKAFIRSQLNNKVRLLLAGLAVIFGVNVIYQLPHVISNLGERTVKVAVLPGTDRGLVADLTAAKHVKVRRLPNELAARQQLSTGSVDAAVLPPPPGGHGVVVRSAGIFGALASKTVSAVALRRELTTADSSFLVIEERDAEHAQLLGLLLPTLLTVSLVGAAFNLAVGSLGALRTSGMLQRLRVTGVRPLPLLSALVTANLLLTGVWLILLMVTATMRIGSAPAILPLTLTFLLGFALLSSAGLLMVSRFKNAQNAANAAAMALGVLVLPATLPVPNLASSTAQWLVTATPTGALTEAFRAALHGADAQPLGQVLPIVAGWAVLLTLLAARFFRWDSDRG